MPENHEDPYVTPRLCREYQALCRGEILAAVKSLGEDLREWARESREDRAEIHQEIAALSAAVNYQKGVTNGHPHRRTSDTGNDVMVKHRREEDSLGGWVLRNLYWLIIVGLLMAALAGERLVTRLPSIEQHAPSATGTHP